MSVIGTPMNQPESKPKKSNLRAVKGAGAAAFGMFFFGSLALWIYKAATAEKVETRDNVTPFKGSKDSQSKQETADEERRRLMSEIGKKGAKARWDKKKKEKSEEPVDDNEPVQT